MPYTAIVLTPESQNACIEKAIALGVLPVGHPAKCHHVTLAMGDASNHYNVGEERELVAEYVGVKKDRVAAFAVKGAEDSRNNTAHVTIAVFNGAKPKESNDITDWVKLSEVLRLRGVVKICD